LKEGKISGAWFDTFIEEPYSGDLCNFDNVLLTPHVGSYTNECRIYMEMESVDNLLKVLKG
jgi:D-3-phosphoglycerate dehydrogenase